MSGGGDNSDARRPRGSVETEALPRREYGRASAPDGGWNDRLRSGSSAGRVSGGSGSISRFVRPGGAGTGSGKLLGTKEISRLAPSNNDHENEDEVERHYVNPMKVRMPPKETPVVSLL